MISRRLIRIKAFKEIYSRVSIDSFDVKAAEKELFDACERTKDLYCLMLLFPVALTNIALDKVAAQRRKFSPSAAEIARNEKFAANLVASKIHADAPFNNYCTNRGIGWKPFETALKNLYNKVAGSDYFAQFVAEESPSLEQSIALFANIYREVQDNEPVCDALEQHCIWWSEDIDYVLDYLLKRLDKILRGDKIAIPKTFSSEEDRVFAKKLIGVTLLNYDDYVEIISKNTPNWDPARVVLSDNVLIAMGIAEAQTFESIPLKVSINEYVEISKYYSTPKSRIFVNGLLDNILQTLYREGKIVKNARGLVGGSGKAPVSNG